MNLEAQIRLVNYCCTLLHKSVLDDDHRHQHNSTRNELNHLVYAEEHSIVHSLSYAILTFLSVVRCRKEIGTFYRENEHFRELLSAMKHKYGPRSEFMARDPTISNALLQVASVMFDRQQRKKKRHHYHHQQSVDGFRKQCSEQEYEDYQLYRRCANSLCQMIENDVSKSEIHTISQWKFFRFQASEIPNMSPLSSVILLQSILS